MKELEVLGLLVGSAIVLALLAILVYLKTRQKTDSQGHEISPTPVLVGIVVVVVVLHLIIFMLYLNLRNQEVKEVVKEVAAKCAEAYITNAEIDSIAQKKCDVIAFNNKVEALSKIVCGAKTGSDCSSGVCLPAPPIPPPLTPSKSAPPPRALGFATPTRAVHFEVPPKSV